MVASSPYEIHKFYFMKSHDETLNSTNPTVYIEHLAFTFYSKRTCFIKRVLQIFNPEYCYLEHFCQEPLFNQFFLKNHFDWQTRQSCFRDTGQPYRMCFKEMFYIDSCLFLNLLNPA